MADRKQWTTWLVHDQRFVEDRPDVLTYKSAPLDKPLHIKGAPKVDLYAATTGTDADWVVKLIDVAPDTTPEAASQGPSPLIRVSNYRWASKSSEGAMSTAFPRPRVETGQGGECPLRTAAYQPCAAARTSLDGAGAIQPVPAL
jgi:predicted acyl esterase